jgi:hypothetical protein
MVVGVVICRIVLVVGVRGLITLHHFIILLSLLPSLHQSRHLLNRYRVAGIGSRSGLMKATSVSIVDSIDAIGPLPSGRMSRRSPSAFYTTGKRVCSTLGCNFGEHAVVVSTPPVRS